MATTIVGAMKGHGTACLERIHRALLRWTKPATGTLAGGAIVDVSRSKAALVAENALLRQQLIVLRRQVKRPAFKARDRCAGYLAHPAQKTTRMSQVAVTACD